MSAPNPATQTCLAALTPARIAALQSELSRLELDGYLAYATGSGESAGTLRYLTGWMPGTSEAVLLVPRDGAPTLVSGDKNRARAFADVLGDAATVVKTTDVVGSIAGVLASTSWTRVGTAGGFDLTAGRQAAFDALLSRVDVVDAEAVVTALRERPGEEEVRRKRAATRVADSMVQHAMQVAAIPGVTGTEIMTEVEAIGRRLGADKASCWLALGDRPAETYFETFELVPALRPGDRVQIGTTVLHGGYFSQVLRIGVLGEPSAELSDTAERLIQMQDAALAAMTPGAPVTTIGDVLESMIDELCPYERSADPFRFQSCHALGNSYSEPWSAPFLNADRNRAGDDAAPSVAPHQTYEIHPNFTLPSLGHVCAGDVALVTDSGAAWLSATPRGILRLG